MWKARIPLGEALLDAQAMGVLLDQELGGGGEVAGDEERRLLVAEPLDGKLTDLAAVVTEADMVVVKDPDPAVTAGALKLDWAPG